MHGWPEHSLDICFESCLKSTWCTGSLTKESGSTSHNTIKMFDSNLHKTMQNVHFSWVWTCTTTICNVHLGLDQRLAHPKQKTPDYVSAYDFLRSDLSWINRVLRTWRNFSSSFLHSVSARKWRPLSACGRNAAIGHRVEANHCSGDRMRCGDFGDFVCGAPAVERQKIANQSGTSESVWSPPMGSSSKSHRTEHVEHAARFSAGSASTQVCAAALIFFLGVNYS